jgi:protein TonB
VVRPATAKVVSLGERRRNSLGADARRLQRPSIITKASKPSSILPTFIGALSLSIVLHLFAAFGIKFVLPDPRSFKPDSTLEVVLVNSKSANSPLKPEMLAQANLDGGGNTDEARQAKTPLPVLDTYETGNDDTNSNSSVQDLELRAQKLMSRLQSDKAIANVQPETKISEKDINPLPTDMVKKSMQQVEQLEAQIAKNMEAYQSRPKRQFIGARAKEYRFALYVDKWREKIERLGTLNFPQEAKVRKLYGRLQMTVSIKSDGMVERVDINRSSGYKVLDDAAKRIVLLASPFPRFPDDIKRDTDILEITRTWTFTREDQLASE